jgi:hypothetical protein
VAAEFYLASTSVRSGVGLFCWGVASVYGKEEGGLDTAVWLDVLREEALGGNGRFTTCLHHRLIKQPCRQSGRFHGHSQQWQYRPDELPKWPLPRALV